MYFAHRKSQATPQPYVGGATTTDRCNVGGATQSRTGLDGFAIRCITDLLSRRLIFRACWPKKFYKKGKPRLPFFLPIWSGRRVSNSRPQPWQGCALPTELLPRIKLQIVLHFSRCSQPFAQKISASPKQSLQGSAPLRQQRARPIPRWQPSVLPQAVALAL